MINKKTSFFIIGIVALLWFLIFFIIPLEEEEKILFSGPTMGTIYEIEVLSHHISEDRIKAIEIGIDSILYAVNSSMSTYIDSSEISLVNKNRTKNKIKVSSHFYYVLEKSIEYNKLTENMFDPTIRPLLNLWGFRGKEISENQIFFNLNNHH